MTRNDILCIIALVFFYLVQNHSKELAKTFYFVASFYFSKETIKGIKFQCETNPLVGAIWYLLKTITKYTLYFCIGQLIVVR